MAPVTVAGVAAQTLAEALAGIAFTQLVRPGAPVVLRLVRQLDVDADRGADVRHPRAGARAVHARRPRPPARLPFRSGGSLCASKLPDAQAAYESAATLLPTIMAGVNFVLHAAGWLEGGLAIGYEKFILDEDQLGMMAVVRQGRRPVRQRSGARRHPREPARPALPRLRRTRWPTSSTPSTAARRPTTRASSSGPRTARSTPPSGPTGSGSSASPTTSRRRSTRRSTRSCRTTSPGARPSCPTSSPDPFWAASGPFSDLGGLQVRIPAVWPATT